MARDIICRPILLRDIALPRFLLWYSFLKKVFNRFAVMDLRVRNTRFSKANNF